MPRQQIDLTPLLASLPLFKALDALEIERIAVQASAIGVPRGDVLFRSGDPCSGFHAVAYGRIKLALHAQGGPEKVLELIGPGQTFGEAVMFLEKPYMVTAQALEDSKLVFVPREAVFAEIEADPRFAKRLLASLSARLHRLVSDIEGYTLRSGTERVVSYLLATTSCDDRNVTSARLCVTKRVIASRLNLTQAHFSRILHDLAAAGLIAVRGREIVMNDVERLRALI